MRNEASLENPFRKPFRAPDLRKRKVDAEKITALTAYDATMAMLLDMAGVDIILVGDSLGQVIQGQETTLSVTLEEMIYHSRCVVRGTRSAFVVGDLPFLTYEVSPEQALLSAGRLIKESGVHAVKLEGGLEMAGAIQRIVSANIPLIAHIGLTPQAVLRLGGYKVQGKEHDSTSDIPKLGSRERILADALAVEAAGACAVVLECIPRDLAALISKSLSIPTIGIGAGPDCDGQILVSNDLLGLSPGKVPKFVKQFVDLGTLIRGAVRSYVTETQQGKFPSSAQCYQSKNGPEDYVSKITAVEDSSGDGNRCQPPL